MNNIQLLLFLTIMLVAAANDTCGHLVKTHDLQHYYHDPIRIKHQGVIIIDVTSQKSINCSFITGNQTLFLNNTLECSYENTTSNICDEDTILIIDSDYYNFDVEIYQKYYNCIDPPSVTEIIFIILKIIGVFYVIVVVLLILYAISYYIQKTIYKCFCMSCDNEMNECTSDECNIIDGDNCENIDGDNCEIELVEFASDTK